MSSRHSSPTRRFSRSSPSKRNRVSRRVIVGRGAVDEAADRAFGLDAVCVNRRIPEAHRLGIGEAFVHGVRILGAELAQAKARGSEGRVRRGALSHVGGLT
jgi:hypothetical protein